MTLKVASKQVYMHNGRAIRKNRPTVEDAILGLASTGDSWRSGWGSASSEENFDHRYT